MRIRIHKTVLKEQYEFYLYYNVNSNDCIVRQACKDEDYKAKFNNDYTKAIFDTPIVLKGYGEKIGTIAGYGNQKEKVVTYLKIPKDKVRGIKNDIENK